MPGALSGKRMFLSKAFTAITLASLLFGSPIFALGYARMRESLYCPLLARWCQFGRHGLALMGLFVTVSLPGRFGIQNAVFTRSLSGAFDSKYRCAVGKRNNPAGYL